MRRWSNGYDSGLPLRN